MNQAALSIVFAPLLPPLTLAVLAGAAFALAAASLFFHRRGLAMRIAAAASFILLLLNPSVTEEQRTPATDVAVIAVDRSPSQSFGERTARTNAALDWLQTELQEVEGIDLRVVESPATGSERETRLFGAIDDALADVPEARRAGVILLTDGQVHDIPSAPDAHYGPVHTLLSGAHDERDRRLVVTEAPSYGIVGQTVTIRYRVEDGDAADGMSATVVIRQDNASPQTLTVPVNTDLQTIVAVAHAGQNIFDMETAPLANEITPANNRVPVIVNGVRDRLRVLLVSGQPYAGGRTWRDMLTADPGVDLVHFTILREPEKLDATPQADLSLIAFPFDELFQVKLYDFDLIIFDRYRLNRILPSYYFGNIAAYVKKGGALLEASGPSFSTDDSIYNTDLNQILPAHPAGVMLERPFRPTVTDTGKRHPVTQNLGNGADWGRWLRQAAVMPDSGEVLMTGANDRPLLILDRVGEGRVAQLASDQIWLWSRGFEGGGPYAELLRRLAHWLMKEPELEENALDVSIAGGNLDIRRRSLDNQDITVTITAPDGTRSNAALTPDRDGTLTARVPATQLGVYTVGDGTQERFALSGDVNPPELSGVRTTDALLNPLAAASKGSVLWLADTPRPALRYLPAGRGAYGGSGWLGLRRNGSYSVSGLKTTPALPAWLWASALLTLVIGGWWIEGRAGGRR